LDLAQFRELEAFAAFGSDLDAASKAQLDRGARLVELLKQSQYSPFSMADAVMSVWAGTTGQMDDVPVEDIRRFESEFIAYAHRESKAAVDELASSNILSDETVVVLEKTIANFKKTFTTKAGHLLVNDAPVEALDASDIDPTKITKVKK
jgi:F-type H+-transporting ATPase subunit alpha